ncbi:hypothetical protein JHK86_043523 [Glycine max]|nr:hypothetical protein JHK86_043523 [Glycine max]
MNDGIPINIIPFISVLFIHSNKVLKALFIIFSLHSSNGGSPISATSQCL